MKLLQTFTIILVGLSVASANAATVIKLEAVSGMPGTVVEVTLNLSNQVAVGGFQFTVTPVPSGSVIFSGVEAAGRASGWTVSTNASGNGQIVLGYSASGASIESGSGTILSFQYEVSSGATAGTVSLVISEMNVSDPDLTPLTDLSVVDGSITILGDEPPPVQEEAVSIAMNDVTTSAGSTAVVSLNLNNSVAVGGFQFVVTPSSAGLVTFSGVEATGRASGWTVGTNASGDGQVILGYSASGSSIESGSGTILSFQYEVSSGATAGTVSLVISEMNVSDPDLTPLTDLSVVDGSITILGDEPPPVQEEAVSIAMNDVTASAGSTAVVSLNLNNSVAVGGFQFVVTPSSAGLVTFSGVEATGRASGWTVGTNASGDGQVILGYSASGSSIESGSGTILSFQYEVSSGATAGTVSLVISEMNVSDPDLTPLTDLSVVDGSITILGDEPPPVQEEAVSIAMNDVTASAGSTAVVSLNLNNSVAVGGFQFVVTPSSAGLVTFSDVEATGRASGWTVSTNASGNGQVILGYSASGASIEAGSGTILSFQYEVSSIATAGTVSLVISEMNVSDPDLTPLTDIIIENGGINISSGSGSTVISCDFNNDGNMNITDVISLLLYQRSYPGDLSTDFNGDGNASITDAIAMLLAQRDGSCESRGSESNNPGDTEVINGITMVSIPGGTFEMGQVGVAEPVHTVTLSSYRMSAYEITNAQYAAYLNEAFADGEITASSSSVTGASGEYSGQEYINLSGTDSSSPGNDCWIDYSGSSFVVEHGKENCPVAYVTWYGSKAFALKYGFDLPAEAQWEYAAKGGQELEYATDDGMISSSKANFNNNIGYPTAVGSYPANPYGLYDMTGNLNEWCNDYDSYSSESGTDLQGTSAGALRAPIRALRGGSWGYDAVYCLTVVRNSSYVDFGGSFIGFRVVNSVSSAGFQ